MDREYKYVVFTKCLTYNHAPYIEDALNGFAMQITSFPVVFCIVDDASNDGEQDVLLRWAKANLKIHDDAGEFWTYTDFGRSIVACHREKENLLFVILLLSENHHGKKAKWPYLIEWRKESKYCAICEGDDYWISPNKLQRQVDFMESHPEHSLCFHANRITFKNGKAKEYSPYNKDKEMCPMKDLILSGGGFMATNSMLYVRTQGENMPAWRKMSPVGDAPLMLVLAERGKVGYLNDIMSCYRFGTGGSWTQKQRNSRVMRKDTFQKGLRVWKEFDKWTDNKYHKYVRMKIVKNYIHYLGKEILYLFSRI